MKKFVAEALFFFAFVLIYEAIRPEKSCSEEKEKVQFESYVFIDEIHALHTNSKCEGLLNASTIRKPIWRFISEVSEHDISKMCSRCVTDGQSERLREIVEKRKMKHI